MRAYLFAAASCAVLLLGPAAHAADSGPSDDPLEAVNRPLLEGNLWLSENIASPVGKAYRYVIPGFLRTGVHNVLQTVGKPVVFGNDILQGEFTRAGETLARTTVNATLGLGGMIDVATTMGISDHDEDFGQTLAVWGFGEGPYLVLPFFGPSNLRDSFGRVGDYFADPVIYAHFNYENLAKDSQVGFDIANGQENRDAIISASDFALDRYAFIRSAYRQHRAAEIRNGADDIPPQDGEN